ncbi:hypothetical protein G6F55_013923 [Rhizopus delemar]|nr:hypothetical protein G6F55_013923 [Rhizopus delemar]
MDSACSCPRLAAKGAPAPTAIASARRTATPPANDGLARPAWSMARCRRPPRRGLPAAERRRRTWAGRGIGSSRRPGALLRALPPSRAVTRIPHATGLAARGAPVGRGLRWNARLGVAPAAARGLGLYAAAHECRGLQ